MISRIIRAGCVLFLNICCFLKPIKIMVATHANAHNYVYVYVVIYVFVSSLKMHLCLFNEFIQRYMHRYASIDQCIPAFHVLFFSYSCTHTLTRTYIYIYSHVHTLTYARTPARTHTYKHTNFSNYSGR